MQQHLQPWRPRSTEPINRLRSIKEAEYTSADNANIADIQHKIDETKELKVKFEALKKRNR